MLGFQFELERDSPQELFFTKGDENDTDQKRSNKVSQAVKEWCKCGIYEPMLTEKEYRCCYEAASHYLNDNVKGRSKKFAILFLLNTLT